MNENTATAQYSMELTQKPASDKIQVLQIHAAVIPPYTKSKVKLLRGILKSRHPPFRPENLLTSENEHNKHSNSISTNLGSNVTPADVNDKKTSLVTKWKHGGATGRPKVVRIVTPTDDIHTNDVCPSSKSEAAESKEKQSATQKRESGMQPRVQSKLLCNQMSVVNQHPLGVKEREDKVPSLNDNQSFPPSIRKIFFKTPFSKSLKKSSQTEGTVKGEREINSLLQHTLSKGRQKTQKLIAPLSSRSMLFTSLPPTVREGIADRTERITGYKSATNNKETKPPLPPSRLQNFVNVKLNSGIRGRIASARRQFLEAIQNTENFKNDDGKEDCVRHKFEAFKQSTKVDRARLINSSPDLMAIERAVRNSRKLIDRTSASMLQENNAELSCSEPCRHAGDSSHVWPDYRQKLNRYKEICKQEKASRRRSRSLGYLETDIDTLECKLQICEPRLIKDHTDTRSILRPGNKDPEDLNTLMEGNVRARSMDFLIDDDNRLAALPPENTLNSTRTLSEYELRVERSLQNLNLPDWYSKRSQDGLFLKREEGRRRPRWQGLGSRTPSSSSLTSSSFSERKLTTLDRISYTDWRYVGSLHSSRDSLTGVSVGSVSPGVSVGSVSPADPHPLSRHSTPLSGWSAYRSFRQPYLGWRAAVGQTPSTNFSGASSPVQTVPMTNSRSESPGWSPEDVQFVPSFLGDQHEAEGATESILFTAASKNLKKYDGPPPMYPLKYDTEKRNDDPTGSYEKGSRSYYFYKTSSPMRYEGLAHNRSPSRQTSASLETHLFLQDDNTPHLYGENSVKNGTSPKFRASRSDTTSSPSVQDSPTARTSHQEYRSHRSSTNKDFPSYGVPSRGNSSHYHKRSFADEGLNSAYLPERRNRDIFTEADVHRGGEVSILQEQKRSVSGPSGRTSEDPNDAFSSFIHDFDTWFQRTREYDLEKDRFSYIRSIYNGTTVPNTATEKEAHQPIIADNRLYENQNQNQTISSSQHVMRSRPTTRVTLTEEPSTESKNEDDKYHDWYGSEEFPANPILSTTVVNGTFDDVVGE